MIDTREFPTKDTIVGDSDEDTILLQKMADDAEVFLKTFEWCPTIDTVYFAGGVGGVVGLYLVEFREPLQGHDKQLWVVVGDVPSAYFVTDEAQSPKEALQLYCQLMDDWIHSVLNRNPAARVFPVRADRTIKNAKSLKIRIEFIREDIVPHL